MRHIALREVINNTHMTGMVAVIGERLPQWWSGELGIDSLLVSTASKSKYPSSSCTGIAELQSKDLEVNFREQLTVGKNRRRIINSCHQRC